MSKSIGDALYEEARRKFLTNIPLRKNGHRKHEGDEPPEFIFITIEVEDGKITILSDAWGEVKPLASINHRYSMEVHPINGKGKALRVDVSDYDTTISPFK